MSMDTVDDLHYAEDTLRGSGAMPSNYCRPTCGAVDYGADHCTDDTCGCPCHDATPEPEPEPEPAPTNYPTEARLLLAVQLDELDTSELSPAAVEMATEIAADALDWCQRYEREMTRDRSVLDRLAAWFIDNTDEDDQWGSAADFIEYAAKLITSTGRNIEPTYVLLCDACGEEDRTVPMTPGRAQFTDAPIMRCDVCGAVCAHWDRDDMVRADELDI